MGKARGKSRKKNNAVDSSEMPEILNAPHSFVIHRGDSFANIVNLTKDFRQLMEPFTASALREHKNNKIKDFVSLSGMFHVSHMVIFNKAASQLSFKVARMPKGPTLTFKIHQFTLARDVLASMKKQYYNDIAFKHAPLVILNNFTGEGNQLKLMAQTFQNMFPTINLPTVNLSTIKRCVLFSFNPVTNLVDMRHFAVAVTPVGLNRSVKKVILGKVPDLSKCEDIADYIEQSGNVSESEYEDDEHNEVVLPQTLSSKGNLENNKSAVRLHEIGPRLTMELVKIQDELMKGEVLYHGSIVKTEEEIEAIKKAREQKKRLKELRKKTQSENVAKKGAAGKISKAANDEDHEEEEDNDIEYYRQEVGQEPDEELFQVSHTGGRKRAFVPKQVKLANKRRKLDENGTKSAKKKPTNDNVKRSGPKNGAQREEGAPKPVKKATKSKPKKKKGTKKPKRNKNK